MNDFEEDATMDIKMNDLSEPVMIFCYICGTSIPQSPVAMCQICISRESDIFSDIGKNYVLNYCRYCQRYQKPPWVNCKWESPELLAVCLKRIHGLKKNKSKSILVNAVFLYTEEHSRRLKLKLTFQKENFFSTILQQDCIIEFVINESQCDDCKKAFTPHIWSAIVQVRQRVSHKKSLMLLEQIIMKHNAHEKVSKIIEAPDGLDFQFSSKSHSQKFVEFVKNHLPIKLKTSTQLVSHDPKSNIAFNKYTFSIDICRICKGDLVMLPVKLTKNSYGGISNILLCNHISTFVNLVDPFTSREINLSNEKYWNSNIDIVLSRTDLTEFVIINIEQLNKQNNQIKKNTLINKKFSEVYLEVSKLNDQDPSNKVYSTRSHLGNFLRVGDHCLGYDLSSRSMSIGINETSRKNEPKYDIIIVRKLKKRTLKNRGWFLKKLSKVPLHSETTFPENIIEEFKDDIEDDEFLRQQVDMWKDPRHSLNSSPDSIIDVELCNLLDGLNLNEDKFY